MKATQLAIFITQFLSGRSIQFKRELENSGSTAFLRRLFLFFFFSGYNQQLGHLDDFAFVLTADKKTFIIIRP